ncbi:hypothetical protein EGW08_013149, partial [Elysia chlorotica]
MYGRYRNSAGSTGAPRSYTTEPPWATNYDSRATTTTTTNNNNNNNSTYNNNNNSNSRHSNGNRHVTHVRNRAGIVGGAHDRGSTNGHRPLYTAYRYGGRTWPRPSFRDYDFWARFRPYAAPHGTDSHRDRERVRREDRDRGDRRSREEEEERHLVPENTPLAKNVLTVTSANLHVSENTREHRTSDYDCTERASNPRLVVRRGQVFILTLTFQRPWSSQNDDLCLQFSVGDEPSEKSGTLEKFQLSETDSTRYKQQGRGGTTACISARQITFYVYIAPDAIVGEWECQVSTAIVTNSKEVFTYTAIPDIYVLFNPWCAEDQVHYTENPQDLNEYILNEYGCVFNGMADYIGRKPWFYGQINNSKKDPGVITGNWSNNYADGTAPSSWKGSVQILRQFGRTKTAVKYGQCWVFSAVLTTGRYQCGPSPHRAVKSGELSIGHD